MFACNSLAHATATTAAVAAAAAMSIFFRFFSILLIGHLTKIYYRKKSESICKRERETEKKNQIEIEWTRTKQMDKDLSNSCENHFVLREKEMKAYSSKQLEYVKSLFSFSFFWVLNLTCHVVNVWQW